MSSDVSNKEIVFIIGLILVVLLGIFFFSISSDSNNDTQVIPINNNNENSVDTTEDEMIVEEKIVLSYVKAVQSGDISNCEFIENQRDKSFCIEKLSVCDTDECKFQDAVISKSQEGCYAIENSSLVQLCTFEVYKTKAFESAITSDSTDSCLVLEDANLKQRCIDNFYYASSVNKNDKSFCDLIVQEELRNECY